PPRGRTAGHRPAHPRRPRRPDHGPPRRPPRRPGHGPPRRRRLRPGRGPPPGRLATRSTGHQPDLPARHSHRPPPRTARGLPPAASQAVAVPHPLRPPGRRGGAPRRTDRTTRPGRARPAEGLRRATRDTARAAAVATSARATPRTEGRLPTGRRQRGPPNRQRLVRGRSDTRAAWPTRGRRAARAALPARRRPAQAAL